MFRQAVKCVTGLAAVAAVVGAASSAQAFSVFLSTTAPTGSAVATPTVADLAIGATGSLYIYYNGAPQNYDFASGTFGVRVDSSTEGVIKFTGATVYTPEFFGGFVRRWDAGGGTTTVIAADGSRVNELLGLAVTGAGFVTPGGQSPSNAQPNVDATGLNYAFAVVQYEVIGAGSTTLQLGAINHRAGAFMTDPDGGAQDLSGQATFSSTLVTAIPEPASLGLLGVAGLALLARRRAA